MVIGKMMKIETLVATVGQQDRSLADRMNLRTDAVIGNQGVKKSVDAFFRGGLKITYLNTEERGVGRNRNLILQNSSADFCVLADDDMCFLDDYPQTVEKVVGECPDGDVFIFNLYEKKPKRYLIRKTSRVRWYNYARYGAARLVVRRQRLADAGIRFSLLFGGGARYGSGEDTIFLRDCIRKGLKVYAVPYFLAEIDQSADSTWFHGYTPVFFRDKGALYACLYRVLWPAYIFRYLIRYRSRYRGEMRFFPALRNMISGAVGFIGDKKRSSGAGKEDAGPSLLQ